jgi:hypothetical protein
MNQGCEGSGNAPPVSTPRFASHDSLDAALYSSVLGRGGSGGVSASSPVCVSFDFNGGLRLGVVLLANLTVGFNSSSAASMPLALNLVSAAALRNATGGALTLRVTAHPLPTHRTLDITQAMMPMFMGMAFVSVTLNGALIMVKNREGKVARLASPASTPTSRVVYGRGQSPQRAYRRPSIILCLSRCGR